jgi:hypothetical protein
VVVGAGIAAPTATWRRVESRHGRWDTAQIMKNIRLVLDAQKNTPCIGRISGAKTNLKPALPAMPFIARRAGSRVATTHGRAHSCCGMSAVCCLLSTTKH